MVTQLGGVAFGRRRRLQTSFVEGEAMEQEVKAAARRLIARMSHMATREEEPAVDVAHYQSLLAQLALAQLALTYPQAVLGRCLICGTPMHFVAGEEGLSVRCSAESAHGYQVGGA
jgi:hypothetical protein